MTIPFVNYPINARVPGYVFEVDASKANTGQRPKRALIIAPAITANLPQVAQICPSTTFAKNLAGAGSPLALMAAQYRQQDPYGELWVGVVAANAAGTSGTIVETLTGPATAQGTLTYYLCGIVAQIAVSTGMTAAQMATALAAAINLNPDMPVTAAASGAAITSTAKVAGPLDLDARFNHLGTLGGEAVPAGVGSSRVITLGTGTPDMTTLLANLGDVAFDMIGIAFTDTASLDAIKAFLSDATGRWMPNRLVFGHGFAAMRGPLGLVTTALTARNDQHMTIMPFNDSPDPSWIWAADLMGTIATSIRNDPGLPVQYLAMGVLAPPVQSRYAWSDRNTLLYDGGSTFIVGDDGTVRTERVITTYQKNSAGVPDTAFLDVETPFQLADVIQMFQADYSTVFARKKIVADLTRLGGNNPDVVTPGIIKGHTLALYRGMERDGRVQDSSTFKKLLAVEYAGNGRVNVLLPVILAQQLRIVAGLIQFTKP